MNEKWLRSTGKLTYSGHDSLKLLVDPDLTAFYRSLMPPNMIAQQPRWPAHCTIVRIHKEQPVILDAWGRYEGEEMLFNYDPYIREDKTYYWLNVWCDRIVTIRTELGMPAKSRWTLPPSGGHQCFHITIGNKKF